MSRALIAARARVGARAVPAALVLVLALLQPAGIQPGRSEAHEERLVVGRVDRLEPTRRILTLTDARSGERRRIEITPETEVIICRSGVSLAAVGPGALVRVKYLDRGRGEPEAQSILLIGETRSSRRPATGSSGHHARPKPT